MEEIKELISKYNKRKLSLMKDRREYYCDHGHNWCINILRDVIKDLTELNSPSKPNAQNNKNDI